MTHDHDFFTPDNVDEQVDQLSQLSTRDHWPHKRQAEEPSPKTVSLVGDLEAYYRIEQQEDRASIAHAWKRISGSLPRDREYSQLPTKPLPILARVPQERVSVMRNHVSEISRGGNFSRRLGLLVAVLVAALLVGSLAALVTLVVSQGTTHVSTVPTIHAPTATSTPAPVPGKTLYTTPANESGFESLAWSPNSQRVASATTDTNGGVQFWDATTGGHLVTVQMPGGTSEWAWDLVWSPNSDNVAVGTNQHVLIVNGQTGKIISSHASGVPTVSTGSTTSGNQAVFSRQIPASGGFGYRATAWSPDGHLIASALSFGANGVVQVWNPQTGATDFILTVGASENIGALAWSSDGQYIAANTWNTQGTTDPNQSPNTVVAWKVSTHQMIFQHNDLLRSSDAPIVWQPGKHNIAFVGATLSGGTQFTTLEIWDATNGKLVTQHVGAGNGALAWSPDGTYLAYGGYGGKGATNAVIIMDASTGKHVYVYKEHALSVSVIAWSPNGKYIVSAEGNTQGQMVAKVWIA